MKNLIKNKKVLIATGSIVVLVLIIISLVIWYFASISRVSKNEEEIEITIPLGSGSGTIADILKENNLIKSKTAFKIYVKINKVSDFQAGTYYLKQNMNVKEITEMLKTGIMYDPNQLNITYLEGKNIRWLASKIAEVTNNTEEDVIKLLKDEEYIDSLIEKYWFLTDKIKDENIYYSLEGYLFPDTYAIENKDTTVEEIFEKMLNRMEDILDQYKEKIEDSKYDVHEILTIASIIETESMSDEGRKDVSSVIYNRLNKGMAIQSDVTTYYAVKVDMGERDLYQKELDTYNPYNTRGPNMEGKLPIGPISSVSKNSIEAALNPSNTDYIFFVADKNGKLYFTKTVSEHNSIVSKLKSQGLWYEY
ncbi:MAG: endolytic transglycosylase MltG [Clostridia bacterium]|nr:endolytic transglycosylase MltG [Clostridia bacterium]